MSSQVRARYGEKKHKKKPNKIKVMSGYASFIMIAWCRQSTYVLLHLGHGRVPVQPIFMSLTLYPIAIIMNDLHLKLRS